MVSIVLQKIAVEFLVILIGWTARRRGYLGDEPTRAMSRFVVDIAFPALVFTQMVRTVDADGLRAGWYVPVLAMAVLLAAWLTGWLCAPRGVDARLRSTFVFCVAIPNWVYLPLPIAEALYGADGIRVILLSNAGAQLLLWSLGVWILHAGLTPAQALRQVALNPGLVATVTGIVVALMVPGARMWESLSPANAPVLPVAAGAVMQALSFVGGLTVPLQLLVIGSQLASLVPEIHKPSVDILRVTAVRLLVAPVITVSLAWGAAQAGLVIPDVPRYCLYLIAAMPVSLTTALFTERFGGDVPFGAQAIFFTTLIGLVTVPLVFWMIQRLGL
jgi:predicted permease